MAQFISLVMRAPYARAHDMRGGGNHRKVSLPMIKMLLIAAVRPRSPRPIFSRSVIGSGRSTVTFVRAELHADH